MISKLELTCVEEHLSTKAALINQFCSSVVVSGLIIEPKEFNQLMCYEVVREQAKGKAHIYTFMRLLFSNPDVKEADKRLFLKCL